MKFKVTADITDRQTGRTATFNGTVTNATTETQARLDTHNTLTRNGFTVDQITDITPDND